ncbi:S-layer homology domain-containing protein [Aneurinibacillus aneurinilyticus]|uniref:S-layer homology domain-containing protein n=1 Tax=Aneurinibacillus aneurinilyticus TaxID=1391 RepID=A0A848D0Z0_ANEAE|nr:S-layer homology domain-containing protein [Aneurinibacillus aneurinilyticus]
MKRYTTHFASKVTLVVALGTLSVLPGRAWADESSNKLKEITTVNSYLPGDMEQHWARDEAYNLVHADIIKGYTEKDGTVSIRPNKQITRAEFVSLLVGALGLKKSPDQDPRAFYDIEPNQWYTEAVNIASSLGIVKGVTEKSFGPNDKITRGEIAALITRAFAYTIDFDEMNARQFKDVKDSYWAAREISKASSVKIINGYSGGYFKPFEYSTRAEALVMLSNALYLEENAVPADKTLIDIVKANAEDEERALGAVDVERLKEISNKRYTGYHKATSDLTAAVLRKMKEEGYKIEITHEGELKATVMGKWNRIAVVEVDGGTYHLQASKEGGAHLDNTQTVKGVVMLKKDSVSGEWKVYTSDIPLLFTQKMLSALDIQ